MQVLQSELEDLRKRQRTLDAYIDNLTLALPAIQSIIHPFLELLGREPECGTSWSSQSNSTITFYVSIWDSPRALLPIFEQAEELLGIPADQWTSVQESDSFEYSNRVPVGPLYLNLYIRCYITATCRKVLLRHEEKEVYKMVKEMVPVYQIECPDAETH